MTRRPIPVDAIGAVPFEVADLKEIDVSGFGGDAAFKLGRVLGLYTDDSPGLEIWGGPPDCGWVVFDIPREYVAAINQCSVATAELVDAWLAFFSLGFTSEYLAELWSTLRELCNQPEVRSGTATLFVAELLQ